MLINHDDARNGNHLRRGEVVFFLLREECRFFVLVANQATGCEKEERREYFAR